MLLLLLACSRAPVVEPAAPQWPPAPAEWASVPLAVGAISSAKAATDIPPTFRNAAGDVACPVMGLAMPAPADAVSYADHDGVRYYFCCDSCEKLFLDAPATYAGGKYVAAHALDATASCDHGAAERR